MTVTHEIDAADERHESDRGITLRWTRVAELAPEFDTPAWANVILSVTHHTAGVSMLAGTSHPAYYGVTLRNERERQLETGVMRGITIGLAKRDGSISLHQEHAPRMSRKKLRALADEYERLVIRATNAGITEYERLFRGEGF